MSWNQPNQCKRDSYPKNCTRRKHAVGIFVFGGAVVAIVALFFAAFSDNHADTVVPCEKLLVKRTNDISLRPLITKDAGQKPDVQEDRPKHKHNVGEIWYAEDGTKMATVLKNGAAIDVPVFVPRNRKLPKTHIFHHPCDNQIANLLRLEPGVGTFGNRDYKGFKDAFLKSCEEPIIVSEDDDEWTKQLKRDVIETKIELRARMADGEDVEAIMRDTRNEYKKLANIRNDIESKVRSTLFDDGVSQDDMEILVEAANQLLAEKGIAPLKINPFVQRRILEIKKRNNK